MSVVSGVTLQVGLLDEDENDGRNLVREIQQWLAAHNFGPLMPLDQHYGGSKHPQVLSFGGGYNYFAEDEFAAFVTSLPWAEPDNVVLLINPEDGPTKIITPSNSSVQP